MFAFVVTQTFSYSSSDLLRSGPHIYLNSVNSIVRYIANLAQNHSISCFFFFYVIFRVCVCLPTLGQPLEVFILYYLSLLFKLLTLLSTPSSANAMSGVYKLSSETTSGSGLTIGKGILYKL
jgi:succinate-acetate transporter protein